MSLIMSALFDSPSFITHFQNHLFLGCTSGTLLNSALGEPFGIPDHGWRGRDCFWRGDHRAADRSGDQLGDLGAEPHRLPDRAGFIELRAQSPSTDHSGAQPYTAQMLDQPVYLDDGGIHSIATSSAFGDWRMGSMTQPIERLLRQKLNAGTLATASMLVKARDQYKLFWADGVRHHHVCTASKNRKRCRSRCRSKSLRLLGRG